MSDTRAVAERIGDAATRWLEGLDAGQRERARFPFESPERFVWTYLPGARRGLPLGDMTGEQRSAALALVAASMSDRGAAEVWSIIDLELILRELERGSGTDATRRDPGRYGVAVFGEPGGPGPWSWRIGGHHVAVHITIVDRWVVGSSPSFLGANPATVPSGPFAGRRTIDGEETLARALLASLTPEQRRIAVVDPDAPPDIFSGTGRRADLREVPVGIAGRDLDPAQRDRLAQLIRHYLGRGAVDIAVSEWTRVGADDLTSITFAWSGPDAPGEGHYYAVRSPRLLIEYDNTQNGANHIHSVWRDPTNDWGEDLLAAHYRTSHEPG
jgi:hypothetical protein